jgi:hypothetical protein
MRYEVTTRLQPQQVLDHAVAHFGSKGLGLDIADQNESSLVFQGGGGHVALTIQTGGAAGTTVEIETREWDYPVREFMAQLN